MGQLNRALRRILKHTRVPVFASAAYVVTDLASGTLSYSNAGHPHPLRVRNDGRPLERLDGGKLGPALGLIDDAVYPAATSPIAMPETVLFFTDGLFEVESKDGALYDYKALREAVSQISETNAADLCRRVVRKVCEFSGHDDFDDDVCLVAMEIDRLAC